MAYTNEWSDDIPPGSELAKNIDDHIRQVRKDVHERMNSLVGDWTADPVTLGGGGGGGGGSSILIPFSAFIASNNNKYPSYGTINLGAAFDARLIAPLIIPSGKKVTLIEWLVDKGTCTSLTLALKSVTLLVPPPPSPATVSTLTQSAAGLTHISSAPLSLIIGDGQAYYLEVTGAGTTGNIYTLYMARITYLD